MKYLKKVIYFLLPVNLAVIPFWVIFIGEKFVPFFIILLVFLFLFEENKKENLNANKKLILPFLIYIGIYLLFSVFSDDIAISIKHFERQLSILIIPLVIFSCKWNKQRLSLFLESYLIILILICIYGFLKLGFFYFIWSDWIAVLNPDYLQFKFPHLLNVHPTYWSYLLIFGNAILYSNIYLKIDINRYFWWISILIFNSCLLLLFARTPLLINTILLMYYFILMFRKKLIIRKLTPIFIVFIVVFSISIFKYLPFVVTKLSAISEDERFLLWPKALEEIKVNFFVLGEGVGFGSKLLEEHFKQITDPRKYYNGYDLHNQYLRNYLDMGLLGFVSLVYLVISPLLQIKNLLDVRNILLISISLIFMIGTISESTLSILKGILLLSIIFPISMLVYKKIMPLN